MESSNLWFRIWVIAICWTVTSLKGTASMRTHRNLGISQPAAWHLMHRIREGFVPANGHDMFGPVEVDETYIGGKVHNMTSGRKEKLRARAGANRQRIGKEGKSVLAGIKDRATNRVLLEVVPGNKKRTLQPFVCRNVRGGTTVYTDDLKSYESLSYPHRIVCHSVKEWVNGDVHTSGIESFWGLFKRGYHGTHHKMSPKHLRRYTAEFAGRFNSRDLPTVERMEELVHGMEGKRLRYKDLIGPNGLESGARRVRRYRERI